MLTQALCRGADGGGAVKHRSHSERVNTFRTIHQRILSRLNRTLFMELLDKDGTGDHRNSSPAHRRAPTTTGVVHDSGLHFTATRPCIQEQHSASDRVDLGVR